MADLFLIFFFWIRSVQNGSNMIKLDQIGFPHQFKNVKSKHGVEYFGVPAGPTQRFPHNQWFPNNSKLL